MSHRYFTQLTIILILPFLMLSFTLQPVHAEMIGTLQVMTHSDRDTAMAKVNAFFDRQEVQKMMVRQGVDVQEARKRVQALSDAELQKIAHHIDTLPAGGNAVGAVLGAALLIFIILLVTDILGLTHVFPFVNR